MIKFYWCWNFNLRGIHLGISFSWHTSITTLLEGHSRIISVGFILGLVTIEW